MVLYCISVISDFFCCRKSESHVFPAGTEVTIPNLVQFVLSNLTPEERVWALLVVCEKGAQRQPLSFQVKYLVCSV